MTLDPHWFGSLIESADDAIVTKTIDGIVVSWNKAAERLFGYTRQDIVGRPITMIFPPDRLDEERQFLAKLSRGERIGHYETVRIRKDGQPISVSVTLSPIRNGEGHVIGASKVARDVTRRKRAELLDEERRGWLEGMLRSLAGGVIAVDSTARVSFMNDVAERLCGWSREQASGQPIDSVVWLVDEASRRRMDNPVMRALQQGENVQVAQRTLLVSREGLDSGRRGGDRHPSRGRRGSRRNPGLARHDGASAPGHAQSGWLPSSSPPTMREQDA
jgi:PAS domain S-box-containing protein